MSISLIASGIGAIVAAIGSGVMLARCFRAPRGDVIAWSVALLGLLTSLGSQALGHLSGFDSAMFRGMELGGQVIAPLALILALSEVAAKSTAARFCARLYIPALGIVAIVVLALDQLADVPFSKAWPNPAVYYQTVPDYLLMFAVGPVTALVAIVAVATVVRRSGQPGWNAVLPAQLMGGAAALLLAYPALAQLVAYQVGVHLPVASLFAVLCTIAAALTWLAGIRTGELRLAALHGQDAAGGGRRGGGQVDAPDQTGDFEPFDPDGQQGLYRGGGLYRPEHPDRNATRSYQRDQDDARLGWQDDRDRDYGSDWRGPGEPGAEDWRRPGGVADGSRVHDDDLYQSDYDTPDFATGDFAAGDYATGDYATGDHDLGYTAGGWQASGGADEHPAAYDLPPSRPDYARSQPGHSGDQVQSDRFSPSSGRVGDEAGRSQLFGQIAIYTLLEDRVNEFDQLAERVVEQVRSREPGTLVFIVHAVPSAPMQRILYEVYRDRAAYEWHTQQPHATQFEADRRPYVLATNVIELGLQQAKVSPFPSVTELFGEPGYDTSGFQRPDYLREYGGTSAHPGGRGDR